MKQSEALTILHSGKNALLTGPAGTGKSYLLNQFLAETQAKGRKVLVTASTGIAATHIGGRTIHSVLGLGIHDDYPARLIDSIAKKSWVRKSVLKADTLVIDEISMLSPLHFEAANRVCQKIRGSTAPFGDLQVVMCGDFFQLPPITRPRRPTQEASAPQALSLLDEQLPVHPFVFGTPTWDHLDPSVLYLTEQYRQNDDAFERILGHLRDGTLEEEHIKLLESRLNADLDIDTPTRLHTHNVRVDAENNQQIAKLTTKPVGFRMTHSGDAKLAESLAKGCLAPQALQLKQGATVMFVKNGFSEGYVNGTIGTVVDFDEDLPVVVTEKGRMISVEPQDWELTDYDDTVLATITQIPLRLAWAITVHKSQGMTLSAAEIDLSRAFVEGLGYVALSRVASLDRLRLLGFNARALQVAPAAREIDEQLRTLTPA